MARGSRDYGDPLLPTVLSDESFSGESSATLVVVFSTLVAVSGSYVFGSAVSTWLPCFSYTLMLHMLYRVISCVLLLI